MKKLVALIMLVATVCFAQQTITNVNVGLSPNDHTGDAVRTAFQKLNANDNFLQSEINSHSNSIANAVTNTQQGATLNVLGLGYGTDANQRILTATNTSLHIGGSMQLTNDSGGNQAFVLANGAGNAIIDLIVNEIYGNIAGTLTNSINAPSVSAGVMSAGSYVGGSFNGIFQATAGPSYFQGHYDTNTTTHQFLLITNGNEVASGNISANTISSTNATSAGGGFFGNAVGTTNKTGQGTDFYWNPVQPPFNAAADGVTDDTLALSNCIQSAATSTSRQIDLQGKTYLITSQLTMTNTDMVLRNGKLITANNITMLKMANDRQKIEKVFFAGPAIPGNTNSVAVWFENTGTYIQQPVIDGVKATNFWYGIYGNLGVETKVLHCQISACMGTNVWIRNSDQTLIENSTIGFNYQATEDFQDSGVTPASAHTESNTVAFYIYGGLGTTIRQCDTALVRQGVLADSVAITMYHDNFENLFAPTNFGAVDITNSSQVNIDKVNFFNGQGFPAASAMSAIILRVCTMSGCTINRLLYSGYSWAIDVLGASSNDLLNAPWIMANNIGWRLNWVNQGGTQQSTTVANLYSAPRFRNWSGVDNGDLLIGGDADRTACEIFNYLGTLNIVSSGNSVTFGGPTFNVMGTIGNGYMTSGNFQDFNATPQFKLFNFSGAFLNFGRNGVANDVGIQGGATTISGSMDSAILNTSAGLWTVNTNLITTGTTTSTNGFSSYSASTASVSATGYTNTLVIAGQAVDVEVIFSGGTSVILKDGGNTTRHTYTSGPTNASVILKPGWAVTGTAMSGDVISQ